MRTPISDFPPGIPLGRRVGAWLLKAVAGSICFALWFSYAGYGLAIDSALYAAVALLAWLAWLVEGKP
jgi:hypothetical protein